MYAFIEHIDGYHNFDTLISILLEVSHFILIGFLTTAGIYDVGFVNTDTRFTEPLHDSISVFFYFINLRTKDYDTFDIRTNIVTNDTRNPTGLIPCLLCSLQLLKHFGTCFFWHIFTVYFSQIVLLYLAEIL